MYISGRLVTGVLGSLDFTPLLRQALLINAIIVASHARNGRFSGIFAWVLPAVLRWPRAQFPVTHKNSANRKRAP
jgi:hypothetical protein